MGNFFVDNKKKPVYLLPMPLYQQRLKCRGFNQAQIIAEYFNRYLRLKQTNLLIRKKETKPQAEIKDLAERRKNVSGVFQVKTPAAVKGSWFVVVDDIITTGYTVKQAAHTLKQAGAEKVFSITLARG